MTTEKYYYDCDGGSLAIGNKDVVTQFINNFGDGRHEVRIVPDWSDKATRNANFLGSVEGKEIKVYRYDCLSKEQRADEKNVLVTLSGRYGVYAVLNSGDMILEKWN